MHCLYLLCSLFHQVLEIVAVLFQHLNHLVHNIVLHAQPHGFQPVADCCKIRSEQ